MVTVAAATRAPVESVTVPVIVAEVESWASAPILQVKKTIKNKTKVPRMIPDNRETWRTDVVI
jgi:hypothetical protein